MGTPVSGTPRLILRLEGVAVLVASVAAYAYLGAHWGIFGFLFLAPDLSMLGYLAGPRVGAAIYNVAHTYVTPALAAGVLLLLDVRIWPLNVIWVAHIGMDRALGFGLKFPTAFRDTHLSRLPRDE
jgi:hypothetical protein